MGALCWSAVHTTPRLMSGTSSSTGTRGAPPNYGDADYWSARYKEDTDPFDWYLRWEQLKEPLEPVFSGLSHDAQILVLGCGTSTLSEQLYAEGYLHITNVDRCEPVITLMEDRHMEQRAKSTIAANANSPESPVGEQRPAMRFIVAEVQNLPEDWDGRYDAIIDKALLDSVACSRERKRSIAAMLHSVSRVLKSEGIYICISWAEPRQRRAMIMSVDVEETQEEPQLSHEYCWTVEHRALPRAFASPSDLKANEPDGSTYHIYQCKKQ